MTKRYALRDDQWEQIKDLLPGRIGAVVAGALLVLVVLSLVFLSHAVKIKVAAQSETSKDFFIIRPSLFRACHQLP